MVAAGLVATVAAAVLLPTVVVGAPAAAADRSAVRGSSEAAAVRSALQPRHVDPAPPGVGVGRKVATATLLGTSRAGQESQSADPAVPGLSEHVGPSCSGTGTDGHRVQALYVVEADDPDRYDEVLPVLEEELANVDDTFSVSAAKAGADLRVRWVHDGAAGCRPIIRRVVVPAGSLAPSETLGAFYRSVLALIALGHNRPDRKYLVFADAAEACGVAETYSDDGRVENLNDAGTVAMYARVDTPCWVMPRKEDLGVQWHSTAAHELMHTLGAVQGSAPHATGFGHCTDEHDAMCYDDGSGNGTQVLCPNEDDEALFDCNRDDYFNPVPAPGTYLATHWNPAYSSFLDRPAGMAPRPALHVSGPTAVRAGLPLVLSTEGSSPGDLSWTTDAPVECLPVGTSARSLTLHCPTVVVGTFPVRATLVRPDGQAAVYRGTVRVGSSTTAQLSSAVSRSAPVLYGGSAGTLTATARAGGTPVRAPMQLYRLTSGGWEKVSGSPDPVDPGRNGSYTWRIAPSRTTTYGVVLLAAPGAGWRLPDMQITKVTVSRWPTRLSVSASSGRPDVVRGRLTNSVTGHALGGRVMTLQRRYAGGSRWVTVASRHTDAGGRASATVQPRREAYFRWRYAGSPTYQPVTSAKAHLSY